MNPNDEHSEMLRLLKENNTLAKENHELLQKIHRWNSIGNAARLIWIAIVIGLPFAVYFYFFQPYVDAIQAHYSEFRQGLIETPGFERFEKLLPPVGDYGEK